MMLTKMFVLLSVLTLVAFTESRHLGKDDPSPLWWQTTAIYQIYPRSFKDSDNDGVGDLQGIINQLPYFQETGIGAIWLSPIYPSPMVDFGYDISDFKNISPIFGTLNDFDKLVNLAHYFGLKVIMDFVPNHSSDQHEWFQKSINGEPDYEDYYVWKDPKGFDEDGNPIPPNNWLSEFRGSAWEYNEQRQQFYLHKFVKEQPDLNYRNPKLVQEMKDVLIFWMERGVDGFRIDAIDNLFEDDRFLDEPVAYPEIDDHLDPDYLEHIYTKNMPETYDMVQQWREVLDQQTAVDGADRFMTVEIYAEMDKVVGYYGTADRPGAHFPFNFHLVGLENVTTSAKNLKKLIDDWLDNVPENSQSNWVLGNHDRHRIGSRVGSDVIDGMNMIVTLLPGTSVTYYGEEIGMIDNTDITYEEGVDPWGCNYPPEEFAQRTRDFERTPMQWYPSTNAGFNEGGKPWLPVNSNYLTVNVNEELADPYSHYVIYKDLMRARQWQVTQKGKLVVSEVGKATLAILRDLNAEEFLIALINFSHEDEVLDLDYELLISSDKNLTVYTTSAGSSLLKNSVVPANNVTLSARGSAVLIFGINELF